MASNEIDLEVKSPLLYFTQEDVKQILKFHNKTIEDVPQDVQIIRDWFNAQPHLPKPCPDNRVILNILIRNKFSIEKTKSKVDAFYTIRGILPELFLNRLPNGEDMIYIRRLVKLAILPKLVNFNRVMCVYIDEKDLKYDADSYLAIHLIYFELVNLFDISNQMELIIDGTNITTNNIKPITPTVLKKMVTIAEKIFSNRMNAFHVVNLPPYASALVTIVKTLLPEKLRNRIHLHKDYEGLLKFYEKEYLPEEFGGTGCKLSTLSDQLDRLAVDNLEHFKVVQNIRIDESLRPLNLDNDEFLGYHGNFKKLQVD